MEDYSGRVGLVVVQFGPVAPLRRCLDSLDEARRGHGCRIVVIVNGLADCPIDHLRSEYPNVDFHKPGQNLGYAGAANLGLDLLKTEYVVLLNNDVVLADAWLPPLVELADRDVRVAALQPKILSAQDRKRFDYAGASGGFIDRYGYPYARGRVFTQVEADLGQYDDAADIFWASGAVFFMRRSTVLAAGGFDQDFFVYHEETDLCWRLHLMGQRVMVCPPSVAYHVGSATFASSARLSRLQLYSMHRNSLIMLVKNTQKKDLPFRLVVRLLLEAGSWPYLLVSRPSEFFEAMRGFFWFGTNRGRLREMRSRTQRVRAVPDEAYDAVVARGIVPLHFFLLRRRSFDRIPRS
jgi:GT2 family glycosyltransferase